MPDKAFLDTNILIYVYSVDEKEKQAKATEIIEMNRNALLISNQVINELCNTLFKKFSKSSAEVIDVITELSSALPITEFSLQTQIEAVRLMGLYSLQFYDALIIATALEHGCRTLITEDMQNGLIVEGQLTISNPFLGL